MLPGPALMDSFLVIVPIGLQPGQSFFAISPDGRQMQVTVPPGVEGGSSLQVQMPAPVVVPGVLMDQKWSPPADDDGDGDERGASDNAVEESK